MRPCASCAIKPDNPSPTPERPNAPEPASGKHPKPEPAHDDPRGKEHGPHKTY